MDLATFRSLRPEFGTVPDDTVTAQLALAAAEMNTAQWGALFDKGQMFLTAHELACSPYGNGTELRVQGEDQTIYWPQYKRVRDIVSRGFLVS